MAVKIYANLAPMGWVNLTDADDTFIGDNRQDINTWYREGGVLGSLKQDNLPGKLENYPFVNLHSEGINYRLSPFDIQVVTIDD